MTWRFESTYTTPATVRTTTTHHTNSHVRVHGNSQVNTHGNQVSTTTVTPETTTTNTYTRSFYTDPDGYIYDFAWKGWHPSY